MKVRIKRTSGSSPPVVPPSSDSAISSEVTTEDKVEPEQISSSEDNTNAEEKLETPISSASISKKPTAGNSDIKLVQRQLLLLLHSYSCLKKDGESSPEERPRCLVSKCQMMKGVWIHMKGCEIGPSCSFQHCSSSQNILAHWKSCRVMDCRVCHTIRLRWAQMQVEKEEAAALALRTSSSSAKDNSSEEISHMGESSSSSGQSTTSLSQGYGQGQGRRLPHTMTIEQGSSNGGYVVDNQLINGISSTPSTRATRHNEHNQIIYESNGNGNQNVVAAAAATPEEPPTGSSSFLEGNGQISGFHTCHHRKSMLQQQRQLLLLQQQKSPDSHMYAHHQMQQQLLLQQLRSSRYHRPAYHKLMADLPSHLQFQSQHHHNHQRHSHNHVNVTNHCNNTTRQMQPIMRHYYDEQSVPPSLLMTMTLNRDEKSKRKIHDDDCLPYPTSLSNKVRICCGGGHSLQLPQTSLPINCKEYRRVLHGNGNCCTMHRPGNNSNNSFCQHPRLSLQSRSSLNDLVASTGTSFQDMIDETVGCSSRVNVPNLTPADTDQSSAPSANAVKQAYERLGIPCPSDALNRLLATLPGGSKYPSTASNNSCSDASSECGSEFDLQSSPAPSSRRNSDDDGIEDEEYNTIEDDCQVSFCLSLVQRLVAARKNDDDSQVDDKDDKSNS